MPRVLVDGPLPERVEQAISQRADLVAWDELEGVDATIDAIFTYSHPRVDAALLDRLPNVRGVSNHGVGIDHIDVDACQQRGVAVRNTPGVLDGAVADATFGLLIAAARRFMPSVKLAAAANTTKFDQSKGHGQEVHHATLGIIGFGRIGQQVARRAVGFDMPVIYHQRTRNEEAERTTGASYRSLDALLEEADYVVLLVPLTDSTTDLISAAQLARMKPTAVLVNIARGPVVNTSDLVEALESGKIWAAALDVTDPEPLPRDHPLLSMENCLVTAHLGSATAQTRKQMVELALSNLFEILGDATEE